ncbi:hypothetical protein Lser_V15G46031 [Lactuca serriola]
MEMTIMKKEQRGERNMGDEYPSHLFDFSSTPQVCEPTLQLPPHLHSHFVYSKAKESVCMASVFERSSWRKQRDGVQRA